jgi:NAD(P)H-hydrate epimerase
MSGRRPVTSAYGLPTVAAESLPWLTTAEMAAADDLAVGEFGIELLQMMEHAGEALAEAVMRAAPEGRVTVLAGGGNNGGGGLCAARHLANRGREVTVVVAARPGAAGEHHLRTLAAMGIEPTSGPAPRGPVLDALVGYGIKGPLRGRSVELAKSVRGRRIVSLDLPSGLGHRGAVEAAVTVTLALPKEALRATRPLLLADLGLPHALWARLGLSVGMVFAQGGLVEIVDRS